MKIAIAGKGGVGKTTISGTLCRLLANAGQKVIAIDGDPNPNLSVVLGIPPGTKESRSLSTDIIERVEEGEGNWRFQVRIPFDQILEEYGQAGPDQITLLKVGKPEKAGTGCMCGSHTVVRELVHSALSSDDMGFMILDTEASLEHMKRGTSKYVETLYTVVEPYYRSLEATRRFAEMARQLGIRNVKAIANKVRTPEEKDAILSYCAKIDLPISVIVPYDPHAQEADLKGEAIFDFHKDSPLVQALTHLTDQLN